MSSSVLVSQDVVAHPRAPQTLAESGLTLDLVLQLVLKTLHFSGELSGTELSRRIGLPFPVLSPAIDLLKTEQQVMIVGGGFVGGASYRYRITDAGRTRAALFLESSHYVGFAPVPLEQYYDYMRAFRAAAPKNATQDRIRSAFSHLVISDKVLDQLGPAINAGHSMFVYGPPGNGKTVISQAIRSLLDGDMAIPHALEVEGSIIRVFDPVNHEEVLDAEDANSITADLSLDRRWVRCRRPMVMVGGELTLESLELSYSATTGFYRAPVQAVANGGVLVIDDFGRQTCSPRDLLNRWIVPLESRVDFLTLQTGQKFELPFMTLIVFATNIRPAELVDEAFLRRIQYKIFAESPTVADFTQIFHNNCRDLGATFEPGLIEHLLYDYYRPRKIALRGCHPRDLIKQALSLASYLNRPPHLTADLLEAACNSYFVDDREEPAVYA
ncbi:MAG TPA: ATP-binding protein [Vicinamibacterales bacterium]|nr:ATP-binding protein [Vicinamibacterales bacterium]